MSEAPSVYNFDPATGEYLGSEPCRPAPGGGWLTYPADHASKTHEAPPSAEPGHVAVRTDGQWQLVEDHRGETVYQARGRQVTIRTIGPLPEDVAATAPPGEDYTWDGEAWQAPIIDLVGYAADKRWQVEVGGATWNGWPVHTDRESQGKLVAEILAIERGERADPDGWKFADGEFRLLTNAQFEALALAVRDHVRAAFAIEAAVLAAIASGDVTLPEKIDAMFDALA